MRNHISTSFKLKSADESGLIEGYASVFDITDRHGEAVAKGAFVKTLLDNAGKFPLLWQHAASDVIGATMDVREDSKGLFFSAQLNPEGSKFAEVLWLLKERAIRGVSVGFRPVRDRIEKGIRTFTEIQLFEISLVTVPANPEALVTSVKSTDSELAEAIRQFVDACKK